MDRNRSSFTVLFQEPFWIGVAELWDETGYRAAKVTFGAQPTDGEILQWLEREWHRLRFSPPQRAEGAAPLGHQNPKRARREAVGRLCCRLAARAARVERIFCGLPMVLKGEGPWN